MEVCMLSRSVLAHAIGGMETYIELLGQELAALGHQLTVLTTARCPEDAMAGPAVEPAPGKAGCDRGEGAGRRGPRYIFVDGTEPGVYSRQWWARSRFAFAGLGPEMVFSNSIGAYGVLRDLEKRGLPMVAKCHGTSLTDAYTAVRTFGARTNPAHLLRTLSYTPHHMKVYGKARRVIAVSHPIAEHLATYGLIPAAKIRVVLDGIDTDRFSPGDGAAERQRLLGGTDGPVLFSMSRVVKEKGFHYILGAMPAVLHEHPRARLVIGGEGSFLPQLRAMVRKKGLEKHVVFAGRIPAGLLPSYYRACDAFVLATTFVEGFGIVLAEAMACGRPVAASRIGGIPEVVRDGTTGLLFTPGDQEEVTRAVLELLSDREGLQRMGAAGREDAVRRFGSRRMAMETVRVFEEALQKDA